MRFLAYRGKLKNYYRERKQESIEINSIIQTKSQRKKFPAEPWRPNAWTVSTMILMLRKEIAKKNRLLYRHYSIQYYTQIITKTTTTKRCDEPRVKGLQNGNLKITCHCLSGYAVLFVENENGLWRNLQLSKKRNI